MNEIILSNGGITIVDSDDYEKFNKSNWFCHLGYAKTSKYVGVVNGKSKSDVLFLHREILNAPKGFDVDHINGNKLDNRKENLRICTHQQNIWNTSSQKNKTSKYRGVSYSSIHKKWIMQIKKDGKRCCSKVFNTELEAAYAFDQIAKDLFDGYAQLNGIKKEDVIFTNEITTSNFRGVSFDKTRNKWVAQIYIKPKRIHIGRYDDEISAALAYNEYAIKFKGDKAKLNITA